MRWWISPILAAALAGTAVAEDCSPRSIGTDPNTWNHGESGFLGHCIGQTFLARDTIVTRITVWHPPTYVSITGAKVFITKVDTTRIPPYPRTNQIIWISPLTFAGDSDPPGLIIECPFVCDPPVHLPGPGMYAFFIQKQNCDTGEWTVIGHEGDGSAYPDGIAWQTERILVPPCVLRPAEVWAEKLDLSFRVDFCDISTPTRRQTWGGLKTIYR